MTDAYIVGAVRTATGRKKGRLSNVHPIDLGGMVLSEILARTGAAPDAVEDVIFGCVDQVGAQSANIARNAILAGGLPETVPGTTVDRQCGSSQQAIHFGAQAVMSGVMDVVIAGGVESMSQVPIGGNAIAGYKAGFGVPYGKGMKERYPGVKFDQFAGAEMIAEKWGFNRDQLDELALTSHERAARATEEGRFAAEVMPIEVELEDGAGLVHEHDEGIRDDASIEKMRQLSTLADNGVLTAATSSQIADGAAAVLIASERGMERLGVDPRARIAAMSVVADDPVIMLTGPIPATQKLLDQTGLSIDDIEAFEVNEAFASVPMAWLVETKADPERLNPNGGAMALGHPLGASGAKLMTTLLHELEHSGGRYGLQTMCEGGGLANATLIERV